MAIAPRGKSIKSQRKRARSPRRASPACNPGRSRVPTGVASHRRSGRTSCSREAPNAEFWKDDVSIAQADEIDAERIRGYRQVMDAHLLALARRHDGRLATFDRKIVELLPRGAETERCVLTLI